KAAEAIQVLQEWRNNSTWNGITPEFSTDAQGALIIDIKNLPLDSATLSSVIQGQQGLYATTAERQGVVQRIGTGYIRPEHTLIPAEKQITSEASGVVNKVQN